jgi:hypothetical protein
VVRPPGVHEDDLVPCAAVHREDVLDHLEMAQVADGGVELLAHLTDDGLAVGLAHLQAAAD